MTIRETLEWLREGERLNKTIRDKQEEADRHLDRCKKSTTVFSFMPKCAGRTQEDAYVKHIDLSREIDDLTDRLIDFKAQVLACMRYLDGRERRLLFLRYFEFRSWREVAKELKTTENYARHGLFRQVLKKITQNIDF